MTEVVNRCNWLNDKHSEFHWYHDTIWGTITNDECALFEWLSMSGCQAGLSFFTILKKRDGYRKAFANFDVDTVASFDGKTIEELMKDTGIIRNRAKISSIINNAKQIQKTRASHGSFANYLWSFATDGKPLNRKHGANECVTTADVTDRMSVAMKKAGFSFCGAVIMYAFAQTIGIVNDHSPECFR
jgi:DNA-3-methyladenine glycosylase I